MNREPALRRRFPQRLVHRRALTALALWAAVVLLGGNNLPAQTPGEQTTNPLQQQETTAPPAAPASVWPANQPLHEARVSWDNRGLAIEAYNSSLVEILHQVLAETGTELQGITHDQRIFGTYGPGPAGDVLSRLLDDSGYNVLMIGGHDVAVPLKIILSVRPSASLDAAENNRNRRTPDDDEAEPQDPPHMVTPFGNGDSGKPETPQQIMQDILSRQPKIDQQSQHEEQQKNPRAGDQ